MFFSFSYNKNENDMENIYTIVLKNQIVKLSNEIAKLVKIKSFENENKQSHISEWLVIVKNELQRSKKTVYEK